MLFCCLLIFFKINFLKKFFQEYHQSVKLFGPCSDSLGLIWVQTVCQGYQQMTLVDKEFVMRHGSALAPDRELCRRRDKVCI